MTATDARRVAEMHALYRLYDDRERLLYIGITGDIGKRLGDHSFKRWFPLVETIKLEWCETRAQAVLAESRAIVRERPRYNIMGTPRAARRTSRPRHMTPVAEVPVTAEPTPMAKLLPGVPVTLRDAVEHGLLGCISLAGARKWRHRDPAFPRAIHRDGTADLYDADALRAFVVARASARHHQTPLAEAQSASA